MVRTKAFNNKDQLLTSSLNYDYSFKFLRVESKYRNDRNFRLKRKRTRMEILEWPPPSVNKIHLKHALIDLCQKIQAKRRLAIQVPQLKLWKNLQKFNKSTELQQDTGKCGRPSITENKTKRSDYIKGKMSSSELSPKKQKGQSVWYSNTL